MSNVEKKYFSLSNCCLKNIYSSAQVIDTLLNIANFVMVPLTTIPTWDAGTATTLSITLICIEGGCIFFNQLARQSILINQNSLKLRHDLEKEEV